MAGSKRSTSVAKREMTDDTAKTELKKWPVTDIISMTLAQRSEIKKQKNKITRLEEIVSEQTDPMERLIDGVAETGVAALAGFGSPFLVALLGEDWQELAITDDFGIDTEAIFAGGLYGLGLFLYWRDMGYGKWFFEAGKGAVAAYAGHIGRNLGAQMALPAAA